MNKREVPLSTIEYYSIFSDDWYILFHFFASCANAAILETGCAILKYQLYIWHYTHER